MPSSSATPQSAWDKLWDEGANQHATIGPSYRHKIRWLWKMIHQHQVQGKVLDVACGTGEFLSALSSISTNCTGVDLSQVALQRAAASNPKAKFRQLDIERETLPENFDAVFCTNALEEMKDDESALANMAAMLNSGGYLGLIVPHRMKYWTHVDNFATNQRRYEADELKTKLERNGLRIVQAVAWGWPLYRFWYGAMSNVPQEKIWRSAFWKWLACLAAEVAYSLLFIDDLFRTSNRGSILIVLARKV